MKKILLTAFVLVSTANFVSAENISIYNYQNTVFSGLSKAVEVSNAELYINNVVFSDNSSKDVEARGSAITINGRNSFGYVDNTKFINNSAQSNSLFSHGGAIYTTAKDLTINNSDFAGNFASNGPDGNSGGAIFADSSDPSYASLTLNNVNLTNNHSDGGKYINTGGALGINYMKTVNINNSVFDGNYVKGETNSLIDSSKKVHNYVIGGAVSSAFIFKNMFEPANNEKQTINIYNTEFINNLASNTEDAYGGAIGTIGSTAGIEINIANSIFKNNAAYADKSARGGAIYAVSDLNITDTEFIGNETQGVSTAYGSAITAYYSDTILKNTNFTGNNSISNSASYGGAVSFSVGEYLLDNTNFTNNKSSSNGQAFGGAMAIGLVDATDVDITNSLFEKNTAYGNNYSRGGAIYVQSSKLNISDTDFINNESLGVNSAYGGAISIVGGETTLKNVNFKGNQSVSNKTAVGGAIYLGGTSSDDGVLNILADGKDVEFTDNKANGLSDAIYMNSNAKINLNISDGNKITFNDRIQSSSNNTEININEYTSDLNSAGTLVINASMSGVRSAVNLYGGTLKIGEKGTFFSNASSFTSYDGAAIDLQNGKASNIAMKNVVLYGTTNLKIDADLGNEAIDTLSITGISGSGKFHINDINLISEMQSDIDNVTRTIAGSDVKITLDHSLNTILTQNSRYDTALNSNNELSFDKSAYSGGLSGAVDLSGERQYQMSADEIVAKWEDTSNNHLQGSHLVIKGNGSGVIGQNTNGLEIGASQSIVVDNISSWRGFTAESGGAFTNAGTTTIYDTVFENNIANTNGGAINNSSNGIVNIIAHNNDVVFQNNLANNISNAIHNDGGIINLNALGNNQIVFHDKVTSSGTNGVININASKNEVATSALNSSSTGTVVLNNDMSGYKGDVNLYHGTIKVGENGAFFNPNNFNIYGCTLDFGNNKVQNYNLGTLSITDHVNMIVDVDLAAEEMDTINSVNKITDAGKINVSEIKLLSDALSNKVQINFTDDNLREAVTYTGGDVSYSPIYKYGVTYDNDSGIFDFNRFGAGNDNNYSSYNPSVFTAPVAAQLGGYLVQLNSYDQAFMNIDMRMLMTRKERQAMKLRNKLAYAENNAPMVFSPTFLPEAKRGAWVRPYASFEKVNLRGGPNVSNVMYGSFFGADSDMTDLGRGFDGQFSLYAGYNGSHQAFDGNSLYQNGGTLGMTGVVYKGNFFSALTANVGASVVEASTMYGSESFPMIMSGVASKTGYNFELAKGKFIIQPNYLMSYSFVNVYSFTNAGGVRITSDPLNAIQIAPGIKFIGNLKNGWQPYANISMIWNIIDATKFNAAAVSLPQLSVKPYVEYGVGLQKRWGDRFTGFAQAMIRNGGRNGVALSFGFRWTFGK